VKEQPFASLSLGALFHSQQWPEARLAIARLVRLQITLCLRAPWLSSASPPHHFQPASVQPSRVFTDIFSSFLVTSGTFTRRW
jgi:hypothetical protein